MRKILAKDFVAPSYIRRAESSDEVGNILKDTHFPDSKSVMGRKNKDNYRQWKGKRLLEAGCQRVVTTKKVKLFTQFKSHKSGGPDGIFPDMLKNVFDCIKDFRSISLSKTLERL